jgi:hypothetical protein
VKTIRIDDEVYDELQRRAQPFVDTPNSVLRREFGLNSLGPGKPKEKVVNSAVFLFPHSPAEFPDGVKGLAQFLDPQNGLLAQDRQGRYNVARAVKYRRITSGSMVLFHKDRQIVGEGRVAEGLGPYSGDDQSPNTEEAYEGTITFDPQSLRLILPTITFEEAQERAGVKINQRTVQKISWDEYELMMTGDK